MLSDLQRDQLKQSLRVMQIIVAALVFGVIAFFAASLFIGPQRGVQPGSTPLLTYIGVGFAVYSLPMWAFLPGMISRRARKSVLAGDARRLALNFQTRLIIGCALLEGMVFLNLVAYMIEGQQISLIVAGVLVLIMLTQFPTLDRLERWVESELVAVEQLRALEPPSGR